MNRISTTIVLAAACVSCDSPVEPAWDNDIPSVSDWVTGAAAEVIDHRGRFVLPVPPAAAGQVTPAMALDLAHAFFQTFANPTVVLGTTYMELLVEEHGPFNPRLVRVPRVLYYAESPYAALPDSLPSYVRKHLGPRFVSYYEVTGKLIGVMAASAYNIDVTIENGRVRGPQFSGGEWRTGVIPRGRSFTFPIAPERAVEVVAQATGVRVSSVPRLLLPHRHYGPGFARWMLELERPVELYGDSTGTRYVVRTLYVGTTTAGANELEEEIWVSLPDQPGDEVFPYRLPGNTSEWRETTVRTIAPVLFERVRTVPPAA